MAWEKVDGGWQGKFAYLGYYWTITLIAWRNGAHTKELRIDRHSDKEATFSRTIFWLNDRMMGPNDQWLKVFDRAWNSKDVAPKMNPSDILIQIVSRYNITRGDNPQLET